MYRDMIVYLRHTMVLSFYRKKEKNEKFFSIKFLDFFQAFSLLFFLFSIGNNWNFGVILTKAFGPVEG